jgi:hypothetical protein
VGLNNLVVPELEGSAAKTMELYNKLVAIITGWLDEHISERVIFPVTESQLNGIEDALCGIRRWRANDFLRDLHCLQRQGDKIRVD